MTPQFANAVDPIFLRVLSVLDTASNARTDPESLHHEMQSKLRQAEDKLQTGSWPLVWEQARYGLCAWIDDVLTNKPWDGQRWWQENKLEFHFFRTNVAGTEFFERAKLAQQLPQRDAIEVFYIAVILGFRGLYAMPDSPFLAQQHQLPGTVEEWTRRTAAALSLQHGRTDSQVVSIPVEGAPALESRFTLVGTFLFTLVLIIIASVVGYWAFFPINE
jgi:type VI secretion system protein ImpK